MGFIKRAFASDVVRTGLCHTFRYGPPKIIVKIINNLDQNKDASKPLKCPNCGKLNEDNYKFCKYCGNKLYDHIMIN